MGDLLIAFPHGVWSVEQLEKEGSSGTGESVSLTTGRRLFVPPVSTVHGTPVEEAVSALRQCVRGGDLKFALYWTAQLDLIGLSRTVWYTLLMMTYSDVGIVFPAAPIMVFEMFELWCNSLKDVAQQHRDNTTGGPFAPYFSYKCLESRRIIMTATTMLCNFPKSRLVSHANSALILHNTGKLEPLDWNVKIGANRKLSNVIRPLKDAHTVAVSKAVTCLTQYIVHQFEHGMLRVADMLMHWGHTSLVWDTITTVCRHFNKLEWARYYYIKYERMWYWATGMARTTEPGHAAILFKTSTFVEFDAVSMAEEQKDEIPSDWKARHDPASPCYVMARSIPIQCLLLIVRANPGILEGVSPQSCTQYDSTVDLYYAKGGRFNRHFEVPEQAKTMFTQSGRMHHRGFDYYWNESEKLANQQDLLDPYESSIFKAYMQEESIHGIGQCTDDSIIRRRVSAKGYLDQGYKEPNPFKNPKQEALTAPVAGEDSAVESTSSRGDTPPTPSPVGHVVDSQHVENQKNRFRSKKPGPPRSIDVQSILGISKKLEARSANGPTGAAASSSEAPLAPKRKRGSKEPNLEGAISVCRTECQPPRFLCKIGAPVHLRTKKYRTGPRSQTLARASTWVSERRHSKPTRKKRRRSRQVTRVVCCGPVSRETSVRLIAHSLLEKRIAPAVFSSGPSLVQMEEPRGVFYLVFKTKTKPLTDVPKDPIVRNKMELLRWCQGCLVQKNLTGRTETTDSVDSWIGIKETQPVKNTARYPRPKVETCQALWWLKGCLDVVKNLACEYARKPEPVQHRKAAPHCLGSAAVIHEILVVMEMRLEYLIKVARAEINPDTGQEEGED